VDAPEVISLEIPGLTLSARAFGVPGDPQVLALHGWLDNARSFDRLAQRLEGVRLIALDLPGHGGSQRQAAGHLYAFVDLVAAVYWAAEALQWSTFSLLGHSLGASLASVLAGTVPDRIERLVLLDGIGPATETAEGAPSRLAAALAEQVRRERSGNTAPVMRERSRLVELAQAGRDMDPASVEVLLQGGISEVGGGYTWSSDPRLRLSSRMRLTEAHVLAFLRRIRCPTLFLRASRGIALDPELLEGRLRAVEDLVVREVDGRHHVHLDDPDAVAPWIAEFLAHEGRRN